jgi:hypothetical protein
MKYFLKGSVALILAMGLALPVRATGWFTGTIAQIEIDSAGTVNVFFTASTECGSTRMVYLNSLIGNDDAKAMLAALLAWQAQAKQVNVYVGNCSGGTYGQFTAAYNQ